VQCEDWRMNPVVKALMCLKGFHFVAAVTFVAEMGDLGRRQLLLPPANLIVAGQ
jgi:hypothetical protein